MEEEITRSHLLPTSTYLSYSRFHLFPCFTIIGSFTHALFSSAPQPTIPVSTTKTQERRKYNDALTCPYYKSTPEALDLWSSAPSHGALPVASCPQMAETTQGGCDLVLVNLDRCARRRCRNQLDLF